VLLKTVAGQVIAVPCQAWHEARPVGR